MAEAAPHTSESRSELPICSSESGGLCISLTSLAGAAGQTAAAGGWEEEGARRDLQMTYMQIRAASAPSNLRRHPVACIQGRVGTISLMCCRSHGLLPSSSAPAAPPPPLQRDKSGKGQRAACSPGDVLEHLHRPPGFCEVAEMRHVYMAA